jgi:hypothetical protein
VLHDVMSLYLCQMGNSPIPFGKCSLFKFCTLQVKINFMLLNSVPVCSRCQEYRIFVWFVCVLACLLACLFVCLVILNEQSTEVRIHTTAPSSKQHSIGNQWHAVVCCLLICTKQIGTFVACDIVGDWSRHCILHVTIKAESQNKVSAPWEYACFAFVMLVTLHILRDKWVSAVSNLLSGEWK